MSQENEGEQSKHVLPQQKNFFGTEKLKKNARAGTHLPDPSAIPYGYDPKSQFRHIFPDMPLPILWPPYDFHPEDSVTFGHPELPAHELYFGDNLYVLRNLPSESINLIYIDPPFFSNRDYTQIWGDDNEVRSFGDIFQDGMYSYLAWLNARLWEMKRVLKPDGSIYVHCDWHAAHYIKCEMDRIFGYSNYTNEIVWNYSTGGASKEFFARKHDVIFYYRKSPTEYTFNPNEVRENRTEKSLKRAANPTGARIASDDTTKLPTDVWTVQALNPMSIERLGYPTQKPEELLEKVIKASSKQGDVVADFFMGGGTTGAVALKHGRRFIGSDSSRVAVSVSFNRLIEIGEHLSGKTVMAKKEQTLDLELQPMNDIRVGYVGSYPRRKFKGIADTEFRNFVLGLYGAGNFTGDSEYIHGVLSNKVIVSVGPGDPDTRITAEYVQAAVRSVLEQYKVQLANNESRNLQIIGWGFEPNVDGWKRKAVQNLNDRGIKLEIDLISLSSETFRKRIFEQIGDSNIDLKFNRLNELLNFTAEPVAGSIIIRKRSDLQFEFELVGAQAIGAGGRLINAQWDFDYQDQRFSEKKYALNRKKIGTGNFEAVLTVKHNFEKPGVYTIAARVQDNLDGEATVAYTLTVTPTSDTLEPVVA